MNLAQARLVGLFIRAFLYGIYIVILAHCLRWIFYKDEGWKLRRRVNAMMPTITMLVFGLTTASFGVWHQIALSTIRDQELHVTELLNACNALGRTTTLIIDATLVYRCWVVYSMSYCVIYLPLLLLLSNTGLFISSFLYIPQFDARLILTFYSSNIVINLYTTLAIVYQIMRVASAEGRMSSESNLYEICRILVGCGIPYMFASLYALVSEVIGNSLLYPTGGALNSTLNGIAFNLILIRVGQHRAKSLTDKWSDGWLSASGLNYDVQENSNIWKSQAASESAG